MSKTMRSVVSGCAVFCMAVSAMALDVGDPVFKKDVSGNLRLEVMYEKFDRDVVGKYDDLTVSGPGGTIVTSVADLDTSTDSDIVSLRGTFFASDAVSFYVDGGVSDEEDAEDTVFVLGGGIRVLAFEKDKVRLTVFASGHYVPEYDLESSEYDPVNGQIFSSGTLSYYELAAGVLLSGDIKLDEHTTFIPYLGPAVSILDGDIDVNVNFEDRGVVGDTKADVEEDDLVQLVLGGSLLFLDNWSIRVEGRLIGDSSVSGALGVAF